MATQPDFNRTDPWTLAQKFLDSQTADLRQERQFIQRDKENKLRLEQDNAKLASEPGRRYANARAAGQAGIDNALDAEAAGLGQSGSDGKKFKGTAAADPKLLNDFLDGVRSKGLNNPYGLAVIAGTGQIESGWSPGNLHRTWSDPSESGEAGTSGLLMSWRGPRLSKALEYGRQKGEDKPSARTQGEFLADEDPSLIQELQNAGSLLEAQKIINNRWKFAGYNTGGGSTRARLEASSSYLKSMGGNNQTAKERTQQAEALNTPTQPSLLKDETGREYSEQLMPVERYEKIRKSVKGADQFIKPDMTKGVGPKGELYVRTYRTPPTSTPTVTAAAPVNIAPTAAAPAPITPIKPLAGANGYDGSEDEDL